MDYHLPSYAKKWLSVFKTHRVGCEEHTHKGERKPQEDFFSVETFRPQSSITCIRACTGTNVYTYQYQEIMDSNKDIAMRTKCLAEDKFTEKDYDGARKLAKKAKDLFPGLNFITLFITIIDIYISRQKSDWYAVVGLENPATLEQICEKYSNLHHDIKSVRDNVIGAKGALEILSEAFCFLTKTFWTECPRCLLQFQYSNSLADKDLKCFNCSALFLAVKLPPGLHPTSPRTMNQFQRQEKSAVLALGVPSRDNFGDEGTSNGFKKLEK